jgi:hypothetical protein
MSTDVTPTPIIPLFKHLDPTVPLNICYKALAVWAQGR